MRGAGEKPSVPFGSALMCSVSLLFPPVHLKLLSSVDTLLRMSGVNGYVGVEPSRRLNTSLSMPKRGIRTPRNGEVGSVTSLTMGYSAAILAPSGPHSSERHMADSLAADLRTINAARELGAPQPPQNPLARLMAPTSQVGPESLTPSQVRYTRKLMDKRARDKGFLRALGWT